MKKTIAMILVLVIASMVLFGCKPVTEEPAAPTEPSAEEGEATPTPSPEPAPSGMLSGLQCVGDNIQGTIKNVLDREVTLDEMRVLLNGMVVNSKLLNCDKATLGPGKSTTCESLQGVYPIKGTNVIAVVMGSESVKETISC